MNNKLYSPMYAAQDFFRNHLSEVLQEKGAKTNTQMIVYLENLNQQHNCNIPSGAFIRWLNEGMLPRWTTLETLADWLDCEITDLLPEQYHSLLKGK